MLKHVDRMLLAVRDRAVAADTFRAILGAEPVRDDTSKLLAARRTVVQAGISEFDLLEPAGEGPVATHLERWGEGILGVGFSTTDLSTLGRRLSERGITHSGEDGRLFIPARPAGGASDQTPGMNIVLSPHEERSPVGLVKWLYEVTNLVDDHQRAAAFYADIFGLDDSNFSPIESEQYGYTGQLTLFNPPQQLDRIELSQPTEPSRAMGRFHARRGQSIYMGYVETDDVAAIQRALEARGGRYAGRTNDPNPEGLFIHPTALHGMLLGVSRTNLAWTWSGRPELAKR
ncbi:MAG: VOC family protein [Chloroflexi bacterium]|nr:VOC family protein [Chloroflexota bacterium]